MTPEQITAIAREFAEEMIKGKPSEELPNCLKNSMLTMNMEYITEIFQWLTQRYCLVEKDAVRKEYEDCYRQYLAAENARPLRQQYLFGRCLAVMSLFPEIAKKVKDAQDNVQ